jgi:hypothetical protein
MISMHPRTWFPLILVTITMALLVVVLFLFGPALVSDETSDVLPRVVSEEYESQAKTVVTDLYASLEKDQNNQGAVQEAQNNLLALTVPVDYQELHLEMVIATNLMIQGYSDDDQVKIDSGWLQFKEVAGQYSWLK